MKFKLIKQVDGEVNCYGQMCKTGGTIDLDGHLAVKAQNNPNYEAVIVKKKAVKKAAKK